MGHYRRTDLLHTFYHHTHKTVQNKPGQTELLPDEINPDSEDAVFHKSVRMSATEQENRQHRELDTDVHVVFIDICQAQKQQSGRV